MAWIPVKTGLCPVNCQNTILNNFTCYASPEVYEYLKKISESEINFVLIKNKPKDVLLHLKKLEFYEKNRVFIQGYTDDSTVFISIPDEKKMKMLSKVELAIVPTTSDFDMGKYLDGLKDFIISNSGLLPIRIDETIRIICEKKMEFKVTMTSPVGQGILSKQTEISVNISDQNEKSSKLAKNEEKVMKTLRYTWPFLKKSISISKDILFANFMQEMKQNYCLNISEIPIQLAEKLIQDTKSLENSSSHVIFMNHAEDKNDLVAQFYVWPGKKLVKIPIILCRTLTNNEIFMTPTCAQNLNLEFNQQSSFPIIKKVNKDSSLNDANEVNAVPLRHNRALSETQIDTILGEYFQSCKIIYFENSSLPSTNISIPIPKEIQWKVFNCPEFFAFKLKLPESKSNQINSLSPLLVKISPRSKISLNTSEEIASTGSNNTSITFFSPFVFRPVQERLPMFSKTYRSISPKNYILVELYPNFFAKIAQDIFNMFSKAKIGNLLMYGHPGSGKEVILKTLQNISGLQFLEYDCRSILSDSSGATEAKLKNVIESAKGFTNSILVLNNVNVLAKNRDGNTDYRVLQSLQEIINNFHQHSSEMLIIGEADLKSNIDVKLMEIFDHVIEVPNPESVDERFELIKWIVDVESFLVYDDENLREMARFCTGFLYEDIKALVRKTILNAHHRIIDFDENYDHSIFLEHSDCDSAMEHIQSILADAIGAPKIPKVQFQDVGGLNVQKQEILNLLMPLLNPELQQIQQTGSGFGRSGILMYGPPGSGKTLLAKAVATECKINFLSVKGPELLNMYVGQSEENVREVFSRAQSAAPAIVFFDELDALAPKRGNAGDSGGVMDRIVSQLLAELDQVVSEISSKPVFVIGATNRPDLIDQALLRPGRFDRLVYVGPPEAKNEQLKILEALTRKFKLNANLDLLADVIYQIPSNFTLTGADFYALVVDTMMAAMERLIDANEHDLELTKEDFHAAIDKLVPSVSPDELMYYKSVQNKILEQ